MALAQLDENNIVTQVLVVNNDKLYNENGQETEQNGIEFLQQLFGAHTRWVQTSYNNTFRHQYAGIGFIYEPTLDAFILPQPFPSWILNTSTCEWEAPVPYPSDNLLYRWDELQNTWVISEP